MQGYGTAITPPFSLPELRNLFSTNYKKQRKVRLWVTPIMHQCYEEMNEKDASQ
jgi:hypothetical protein